MTSRPQSAPAVKSWVKMSIPSIQATMFALRELIRTPQQSWTAEQRKWWGSLNIALGQLESDLTEQERKKK